MSNELVILGLGTNIGDRMQLLRDAIDHLQPLLSDIECSTVYESPALLPDHAPENWDVPFYNMAVAGKCTLSPHDLLKAVKDIEHKMGRKDRGHWGPREIDIDILAYGDRVLNTPDLILPHAGLLLRDFALIPLAEIAPQWLCPGDGPVKGMTASTLACQMESSLNNVGALP